MRVRAVTNVAITCGPNSLSKEKNNKICLNYILRVDVTASVQCQKMARLHTGYTCTHLSTTEAVCMSTDMLRVNGFSTERYNENHLLDFLLLE